MIIIDKLEGIENGIRHCCLTIGNFDGVHLGHREIIRAAHRIANDIGKCPIAVMTFDPHPSSILHPERLQRVLTPLHLKAALLEQAGVDYLIVLKDNYQMLTLSPEDFIINFMMKEISPKAIIEGDDFHFGYGRSGDVNTLMHFSKPHDYKVSIVEPQHILIDNASVRISSTMIRHLLHRGYVADAARALGRPYRLIGSVVKGRGKGSEMGFPTANIDPHEQVIPAEGVYAGFVSIADSLENLLLSNQKLPAVFSLGRAKTFVSDHPLLIEAHLLDKNIGDLYGKVLSMDFVDFIRTQQRFDTEEKLKEQILKDCQKSEMILSNK
ncbi:MAG: bifunctional riboflavin kinase/FAD synthetase [Phycisphaerales bacterium]